MINVTTKIHDKFSIEFKVGFAGSEHDSVNDFTVNSWIFVPYSLDINPSTYGKEQFYRDVKSNVRLITPSFRLPEMTDGKAIPLQNVKKQLQKYVEQPTEANLSEYNFHVRLFAAIFKSALRNEVVALTALQDPNALADGCRKLITCVTSCGTCTATPPGRPTPYATNSPISSCRNAPTKLNRATATWKRTARPRTASWCSATDC